MTESPSPLTMLLFRHTRRRDFIALLGGAAVPWPLVASAQQSDRVRKIAVLMNYAETGTDARIKAFQQGLRASGWTEGRNVRIDYRWAGGDVDRLRIYAAELVSFAPDVIFASPHSAAEAVHRQTGVIPIVAVQVGHTIKPSDGSVRKRAGASWCGGAGGRRLSKCRTFGYADCGSLRRYPTP